MIRQSLVILLLLVCTTVHGQVPANTPSAITVSQFKEDFEVLRKSFEQTYPSLYRFKNKSAIDKLFDSCHAAITTKMTPEDFYRTIKFLLSTLSDGHLSVSPSQTLRTTFENQGYFPLSLVFLDSGVFTFCDYPGIAKGSRVQSIDGIPIQTIINKVRSYLVADGQISTSKNCTLNSTFWFSYYLAYGQKQNFVVRYTTPDNRKSSATLNAVSRSELCESYNFSTNTKLLDLSYPNDEVALMTLKTFNYQSLKDVNLDFGNFLDSAFKVINTKGIRRLIMDLRGNGGGADVYGSYLYSWLTGKPFRYYKELVTTVKKLTEADHPNLKLQQPNDITYDGKIVFLINGLTFSAAAEFCAIAKSNNRGMFVGEETGGGYFGNTSGQSISTVLPNTSITVFIPTTKYVMDVSQLNPVNRGTIPDYNIVPSISEIFHNRDIQLLKAIELLKTKKGY